MSILSKFRKLHSFLAPLFFIFFISVSVTAILLAFKSNYSNILFKNRAIKFSNALSKWKPMDSLELSVTKFVNEKTNHSFKRSEKAEVKVEKGSLIYYFKDGIIANVNGENGEVISIEKKYGGLIQDIHDGAIIDSYIKTSNAFIKKMYTIIVGLAFFVMTITGIYLWYKPILIKSSKF